MAKTYIVEFGEAIERFQVEMDRPHLPTIDIDAAKWCMMSVFEKANPQPLIDRTAYDLAYRDWLVSRMEIDEGMTPLMAREAERMTRAFIYNCLLEMGQNMFRQLRDIGMYRTGNEKYKISNSPINNDTYLLDPA